MAISKRVTAGAVAVPAGRQKAGDNSNAQMVVRNLAAKELIFGIVGPVGSGTSEVATALENLLRGKGFVVSRIAARDLITRWAEAQGKEVPPDSQPMKQTRALQDAGDDMRKEAANGSGDGAAVALRMIGEIRKLRADQMSTSLVPGEAIEPDGGSRAYILDSLRNPAEVALLRNVYQDAFCLIGVVCREGTRDERLHEKYHDASKDELNEFKVRDEKGDDPLGQQVADTFHLADYFLENSVPRFLEGPGKRQKENPDWDVSDQLERLVALLTHNRIVRPRPAETGMFHAWGAAMRSACLSRQVGAALMDAQGNLLATGTNEVPRAGGGVYGAPPLNGFDREIDPDQDFRCCSYHQRCSNTHEQIELVKEMLAKVPALEAVSSAPDIVTKIRKTRVGQLIEFSRAVHAEMEALFSAARQRISPEGTRLFVTTFPCHNCARHIVVAGVDEVQFIEPYLKSKALVLHDDAITTDPKDWVPPSQFGTSKSKVEPHRGPKVLFRPFTGVAPRLYRRVFAKDRDYKNDATGEMLTKFGLPKGLASQEMLRVSYAQVEAVLARGIEDGET